MRYPLDGPVRINSPFGPRGTGFHFGVDLYAMPETPAYAVDSGVVFYTAFETAGGNHLAMYLDHPPVPEAPKAGYMHLARFAVGPGTRVNEGDLIGWTDTTGQVSGPHLHFWMGTNANVGAIDPMPYISGAPAPIPETGHQMTDLAVDFQYLRPSAEQLIGSGYRDAIVYLGNPRLANDACPSREYLAALVAGGVRYTFIYETDPNRSQNGYATGVEDARFSEARAAERGYPADGPFFVCASDGSATTPNYGADAIAEYARGFAEASGRQLGAYGNRYTVDAFNAGVRRVNPNRLMVTGLGRDGGWIPTTWGANPARDLLGQDPNVKPVPNTDHNYIYANWWPIGTPSPDLSGVVGALRNQREDTMFAWTKADANPQYPFFVAGMMYEFTPTAVTPCPGLSAANVLGAVEVTDQTMYALISARWRAAKALNIPLS